MRASAVLCLVLLVPGVTACGDDDGGAATTPSSSPTPSAVPSLSPTPTPTPAIDVAAQEGCALVAEGVRITQDESQPLQSRFPLAKGVFTQAADRFRTSTTPQAAAYATSLDSGDLTLLGDVIEFCAANGVPVP